MNPRPKLPTAPEVAEFLESMPAAYAAHHAPEEVAIHAAAVARRGQQIAHVESLGAAKDGRSAVLVVADDRAGLLSVVTDALLVHGLGVAEARAYCRNRTDGVAEAVDVFVLERIGSRRGTDIDAQEISGFAETLRELLAEQQLVLEQPSSSPGAARPGTPSRVYFDLDALRRGEFVLRVETPDVAGLLFAITSALHAQRVRVVSSEVKTEDRIAQDRFELASSDGEALTAIRLCDIQQAVHAAVRSASALS